MKHVRELGEKDRKAQLELICEGFPWNTPEAMKERFDLLAAHSDSFGSFEDDVLASQIISTPYTIDFYGTKDPMAGIGFVATSHNYQHQHRIDDLMSYIFEKLHKDGTILSYLAPFSYRFYRRFGYETIFDMLDFAILRTDLPADRSTFSFERMDWDAAKDIVHKIYEKTKNLDHGMMIREPWWEEYKFHLRKPYEFMICYDRDTPIGYMAFLRNEKELALFEIEGSEDALKAMIGRLREEDIDRMTYTCTPQQNRLYELLEDRSKDSFVMIRQGMMARIMDVAAFLEQYPFAKKAEFALEILEDQYAPWNAGIYEVRHTKEMTKVKKVFATSLPCAKMDVQALVRLFFGNMDPKGIVADEKVWKILRKCLRQDVVNFSDYF